MSSQRITNKQIVNLFFTRVSTQGNQWKCECGTLRLQAGSGYSNLLQHLSAAHGQELEQARKRTNKQLEQTTLPRMLYSAKVINIHGWMSYIIHCLRPFSDVEHSDVRNHVRYDNICVNTFKHYMRELTVAVEKTVSNLLPAKFALVFDVQTTSDTHYVAVFATYSTLYESGCRSVCLALSPLENEESQGADEHIAFLTFVLSVYGKTLGNVVAVLADNCSVNQSIARKLRIPLVGFASHRFQLAVEDILQEHEDVISVVHSLMLKFRSPLYAAKLRRETYLKVKIKNDTRWSSCYEMMRRYCALREHFRALNIVEVDILLPNQAVDKKIDALCKKLSELDGVTKALQRHDGTIATSRVFLDTVLEEYPSLHSRLERDARIVQNPVFENAVVKVEQMQEENLTDAEKESIQFLLRTNSADSNSQEMELTILQRAAKRLKTSNITPASDYIDTRFLLPTSKLCERFFSIAEYALKNRRKGILPSNLEAQLFLFMNRDLWSIEYVKKIVHWVKTHGRNVPSTIRHCVVVI